MGFPDIIEPGTGTVSASLISGKSLIDLLLIITKILVATDHGHDRMWMWGAF